MIGMLTTQLFGLATLLFQALGSHWDVLSPPTLKAVTGSCLLIPCEFSFPSTVQTPNGITAIWFLPPHDQRLFVYHSNAAEINGRFRGRTELLGDPNNKNCTLLINNMTAEDQGQYTFRFEIDQVNRWSAANAVSVTVSGTPEEPEITVPADITEGGPATLSCSTPYFCPDNSVSFEWKGSIPENFVISSAVQVDTSTVLNRQNIDTKFSWLYDRKAVRCELSVGSSRAAKEVILNVKHSPKGTGVLISPNRENIKQGDSVSISCNVNSSDPEVSDYAWFKDEAAQAFSTGKSVSFPQVARTDYGQYRCEAKNLLGTGVSEAITLTIFSARILVTPSPEVLEGATSILNCDVPGGDPVKIIYSWYKNNIWLKEGTARVLVFHQTTSSDTGYYTCKVQNDKGSDTSLPVAINVVYPPRTPVITSFLETQEGKVAIIHCTVDSNPVSDVALQRNGKLIANTTSHGAPNQRFVVSSTRNSLKLEIRDVVLDDGGMYVCTVKNVYGNSTASQAFYVATARILISPSTEVREGELVTLTCVATKGEQTAPKYTFFKNSKWLKESSDNVLSFRAVESGDAGSYHCKSESVEGSSTSPSRTLTVLYPPRKPVISSFLELQQGHLGIVQCSVESEPPSELSLYRRDGLVASTSLRAAPNQRFTVSSSHNSLKLEIQGVAFEDEGQYMCLANNTYGAANASIDFTAETARIVVSPSAEVQEGTMVNLTCELSSDNKAGENYTWFKNGEWLSESYEPAIAFEEVKNQDAGSYYCKVWNEEGGKSSSAVNLNVLFSPRNTLVKSFLDTEGRLAIIRCTTESNPPSRLTLYRNGEAVASSDSQTRTALGQQLSVTTSVNTLKIEIRGVKMENEGEYQCSASNAYGTSSHSLYFRVQTARVLIMPSKEIREGDTVTLTCDITGSTEEEISYVWYKNSKWFHEDPNSSLVFQQIRSDDTGYYHCRARDKDGTSTSPSVNLNVFYPPRNLTMSAFLELEVGQLGIIQCSVDSDPPSELTLYRGDAEVASTTTISGPSRQRSRVSSTHNSLKLEIPKVLLEDEGVYTCLANNTYGEASSKLNFTAETARVLVTPSTEILEGTTVTLDCVVSSGTTADSAYSWYKSGNWYKQGSDKTLVLKRVTTADAGSYHCKAQNTRGSKSSSPVALNILYPPRNALIKSFLETGHGKLAIVQCTVDSNPPSELSLLKDDTLLVNASFKMPSAQRLSTSYSQNAVKLEIQNVINDDEGEYTCKAGNEYGATTASVQFTVEGARVLITPSSNPHEGDTVTLTCDVTTNTQPVARYIWYKNSKWLLEGSTSSLVMEDVTNVDTGSYSCDAHSSEGSEISPPVIVQVLYPPRNLLMTSYLETQRGNLGIILCSVDSYPPSEVVLYRGDEVVASGGLRTSTDQRISVSVSHNSLRLDIKDVMVKDQGEYVCSANNTYGHATTSIYFTVETARIMVEPSPEVQEGDMLNLTCVTTSGVRESANYTWYKNNRWFHQSFAPSLMLQTATGEDTGSYQCVVEDTEGSRSSLLVGISVFYAPRDIQMTSFFETQGKQLGIIQCTVDSSPPAILTVSRNNERVASTGTRHAWNQRLLVSSSHNALRLEIRDAKVEDSANYVCTANNTLGDAVTSLYFSVQAPEEIELYKALAWVFIVVAVTLVLVMLVVSWKICKRKLGFSKLNKEDNTIEMASNKGSDSALS